MRWLVEVPHCSEILGSRCQSKGMRDRVICDYKLATCEDMSITVICLSHVWCADKLSRVSGIKIEGRCVFVVGLLQAALRLSRQKEMMPSFRSFIFLKFVKHPLVRGSLNISGLQFCSAVCFHCPALSHNLCELFLSDRWHLILKHSGTERSSWPTHDCKLPKALLAAPLHQLVRGVMVKHLHFGLVCPEDVVLFREAFSWRPFQTSHTCSVC